MPNWRESMEQTFEFYTVDPGTWKETGKLDNVKSCSITRDSEAETLGSAIIDITESVGECYIRVYLVTIQNGVQEKHPLGTFLVQTPSSSYDGRLRNVSMDAYTPLIELKENPPPFGYSIPKNENIMDVAYSLCREHMRGPVVKASCETPLYNDFVANANDTWLTFLADLISNAKYTFDLDEMGRVLFAPKQELDALRPIWTYEDGEDSIMYPEIDMDHDLYGIPNVVEVIYSKGGYFYYARVVNDDPNSPTSTVSRGREIVYRNTDPGLSGIPDGSQVQEYAEQLLRELSTVEYKVRYSHAYCGTRIGDCVRINYKRAGLTDIKAKIISQTIKCEPGCPVSETAVFTTKLWR